MEATMDDEELKSCRISNKEWICPMADCNASLSRKQTLQNHLWSCHSIKAGNPTKRYKLYEVNENVPLPKTTYYRRKINDEETSTTDDTPESQENQEDLSQMNNSIENTGTIVHYDLSESTTSIEQVVTEESEEDIEIEEEQVENFIDNFGPPLYLMPPCSQVYTAPISQYHHYMTLCSFVSYHNLSDRAFRHLIKLIGLHIPPENLMETNVDTLKGLCGFESDFLKQHLYCSVCKKLFTGEIENCTTPGCLGKREKSSMNYFVTGSMQIQLKEILERNGIWTAIQEYASERCTQHTTISDIVDGAEYKKLKENNGFLTEKNNITLSLFTDGIPLFQSSKVSLWPVYLILNELPPKQRFTRKNMILWGIWQGCGKPQMNMFLRPLVEDLVQLYQRGVDITINSTLLTTKAMMIIATMDLQARAYVLQMTQHNGQYGCLYCLEAGVVVKSGKGSCRSYPYREVDPDLRTMNSIRADAQEAATTSQRVHGLIGQSVLSCLPYFDISKHVVIDYMHGILLGITKKLMSLWFDGKSSSEIYYIGNRVDDIDNIIKNIKPPYFLKRLPRKIFGNYHHWKASEYRSWLLYYSVEALKNILPDVYLTHYSLLVEGTFLLLGEGITRDDLKRADYLLRMFVKHMSSLYKDSIVGLNVHNLVHLTSCVERWGPLWAWSCFVFESFNGEIKKAVHGTGNACRQIFWSLQCQKKVESLAIDCPDEKMKEFYQCMIEGSNIRQKGGEDAFQCVVFTPVKVNNNACVSESSKRELLLLCGTCIMTDFNLVKKISRNGFLMFSKQCSRVVKRNSYTIRTVDGCIIEVEFYLIHKHSKKVFAISKKFGERNTILRNRVQHLHSVDILRPTDVVVKAELLQEPVVVVKKTTELSFAVIPNNIERD